MTPTLSLPPSPQVYMLVSSVVRLLDAAVIRRLIYTAALLVIGLVAVFIISMQLLGKVQVTLNPSLEPPPYHQPHRLSH